MPTYDYVCDACEHAFEQFQSMTAKPLRKCPACSKTKLRRLIGTGAGVIFKGSGFYETDYRSDSYKKAAKADSESGSSKSDSSDKPASTETKGTSTDAKADKPAKPKSKSAPAKKD